MVNKHHLQKKEPSEKIPFHTSFIFLVDKLNIIDFNIFNMLKFIFTCEYYAISFSESPNECKI